MGVLRSWHRAALAIALALLVFAGFSWLCLRDPKINFLPSHRQAEWIIFPSAVDTLAHPVAYIDTTFRRAFMLEQQSRAAQLRISAAKRFQLKINGASVETGKMCRRWTSFRFCEPAQTSSKSVSSTTARHQRCGSS